MPDYWWRVVYLRDGTKLYFCEPTSRGRKTALAAPYCFAPVVSLLIQASIDPLPLLAAAQ
jgi:hypothetical protein